MKKYLLVLKLHRLVHCLTNFVETFGFMLWLKIKKIPEVLRILKSNIKRQNEAG